MPYYVASGRSITSPRGIIEGGAADSEVSWRTLCKNASDPKQATLAEAQFPRLLETGAIVEASSMPLSPAERARLEALAEITTEVELAPEETSSGDPVRSVKQRAADQRAKMKNATVLPSGPAPEPAGEPGEGGTTPEPAGEGGTTPPPIVNGAATRPAPVDGQVSQAGSSVLDGPQVGPSPFDGPPAGAGAGGGAERA